MFAAWERDTNVPENSSPFFCGFDHFRNFTFLKNMTIRKINLKPQSNFNEEYSVFPFYCLNTPKILCLRAGTYYNFAAQENGGLQSRFWSGFPPSTSGLLFLENSSWVSPVEPLALKRNWWVACSYSVVQKAAKDTTAFSPSPKHCERILGDESLSKINYTHTW